MDPEKKSQLIDEFKLLSIPDLVKRMAETKEALDAAKEVESEHQAVFDILRLMVLPEKMDEEDVSTMTVAGVGRVSIQSDIYFSIPAALREEAFDWLRDHGHGDIIQETVNSSTGKAWAKEAIKKGEVLPEDLFKVTPFSRVQLTRIRG